MSKKVAAMAVFILFAAAGYVMAESAESQAKRFQQDLLSSTTQHETRPTQDPNIYAHDPMIKEAYQIAKEIPGALDKIFCYCYCETNPKFKHKSLLTCYVDDHAAKCGTCMREAIVTKQLLKQGKKIEEIAKTFEDYYTAQPHNHAH